MLNICLLNTPIGPLAVIKIIFSGPEPTKSKINPTNS